MIVGGAAIIGASVTYLVTEQRRESTSFDSERDISSRSSQGRDSRQREEAWTFMRESTDSEIGSPNATIVPLSSSPDAGGLSAFTGETAEGGLAKPIARRKLQRQDGSLFKSAAARDPDEQNDSSEISGDDLRSPERRALPRINDQDESETDPILMALAKFGPPSDSAKTYTSSSDEDRLYSSAQGNPNPRAIQVNARPEEKGALNQRSAIATSAHANISEAQTSSSSSSPAVKPRPNQVQPFNNSRAATRARALSDEGANPIYSPRSREDSLPPVRNAWAEQSSSARGSGRS
jgi:hypothetical protein